MMSNNIFSLIKNNDLLTIKTLEKEFLFILNDKKESPLIYAILHGKKEIVDYLLSMEAGVDEDCSTLLMHTMIDGEVLLAKALLEKNVNINHQNKLGQTALMIACSMGRIDMMDLLIKDFKANILLKDNEGKTAKDYATEENEIEILEYLNSL